MSSKRIYVHIQSYIMKINHVHTYTDLYRQLSILTVYYLSHHGPELAAREQGDEEVLHSILVVHIGRHVQPHVSRVHVATCIYMYMYTCVYM